jgi:hypothetical protein
VRSMRLMPPIFMVMLAVCALMTACGINPDGKSGDDHRRDIAADLPLNEWVTDDDGVDYAKGDRSDWKKIVIPREGTLFVEIAFDNKDAQVLAALYDQYGSALGEKKKPRGLTDHITFEGPVSPGKYFVRIKSDKSEDNSIYSIRASMEGGVGVGDIPPPE